MKMLLSVFLLLYVVALHTSMAAMETLAWVVFLGSAIALVTQKDLRYRVFQKAYLRPFLLLVGLIAWVGISLALNPELEPTLGQIGFMRWTLVLLGLAIALRAIWSVQFESRLKIVWLVAFALTAGYAIVQFVTGWDFHTGRNLVNPQGGGVYKAIGFFSMSLTFAYVFGQSTFAIVRAATANLNRKLAFAFATLGALGTLASMSRGAWISAAICLGIYLFNKRRNLFWPALLVLVVGVVTVSMTSNGIGTKIHKMLTLQTDHSSSVRFNIWRAYLEMTADHPIQGVGITQGDRLLPEYYQRLGIQEDFVSHAHNNYLQWLAGTGVVGLFLYLVLASYFLSLAWSLKDRSHWGWGLYLSQLYLHLGGMTEANFFDGEVNHFIVFTWALTWAIYDAIDQRTGDRRNV